MLVVIDDAQWIDESSLAAILFAARRLLADALAIVVASRAGPFGLPELVLPGLDRATAAALLERHAGRPLPPGAADRAFEATLGNPLALVELAASAAELPLEGAVPVRTSVEAAFAARVRALPGPTQRLLALAAADEEGNLGVIAAAAAGELAGRRASRAGEPAGTSRRRTGAAGPSGAAGSARDGRRPTRSRRSRGRGGGRARRARARPARVLPSPRAGRGVPVRGAGRAAGRARGARAGRAGRRSARVAPGGGDARAGRGRRRRARRRRAAGA